LVQFSGTARVHCPLNNKIGQVVNHIERMQKIAKDDGTNFVSALQVARGELQRAHSGDSSKFIVFLTGRNDTQNTNGWVNTATQIRTSGVTISFFSFFS
jgi:hypothetical protein